MSSVMPVIDASNISKSFGIEKLRVHVLQDISLRVQPGERVAIVGASGSGKSTLLHLIGGLDLPDNGAVRINGEDIARMGDAERGRFRNAHLGFVYQFHHLLPEFSALENVAMPLLIRGESRAQAKEKAAAILQQVGLGERVQHRPAEMSGGERQRAAIARALVSRPKCILADEPTGNLDNKTAGAVYELMLDLNQQHQAAIVIVTHDMALAKKMDRVLTLVDKKLQDL